MQVLSDVGEDVVVHCAHCGYAANQEKAGSVLSPADAAIQQEGGLLAGGVQQDQEVALAVQLQGRQEGPSEGELQAAVQAQAATVRQLKEQDAGKQEVAAAVAQMQAAKALLEAGCAATGGVSLCFLNSRQTFTHTHTTTPLNGLRSASPCHFCKPPSHRRRGETSSPPQYANVF